jgi:hypothetical protein
VETTSFPTGLDCDWAQGFLFGRAMPPAEFETWLEGWDAGTTEDPLGRGRRSSDCIGARPSASGSCRVRPGRAPWFTPYPGVQCDAISSHDRSRQARKYLTIEAGEPHPAGDQIRDFCSAAS